MLRINLITIKSKSDKMSKLMTLTDGNKLADC